MLISRADVTDIWFEEGEALGDALRPDNAKRCRLLVAGPVRAGEPGQDLRRVEPLGVARVGHEHRLARRRADHTRVGHALAQQADPARTAGEEHGVDGLGRHPGIAQQALGHVLVHRRRRAEHAGTDEGQVGHAQQALQRRA